MNPNGVDPNTGLMPAPQAKQPGFFQRILPTVGGILGGIAGGAADVASLGTLAPLINPITGAAAGGAAGKAAENLTEGKNVGSGVLGSAVENAAGAGVGGILGKGVQAVSGVASNVLGKGTVDALMNQAPGILDRKTAQYLADNGITNLSKVENIAPTVVGQPGGEGAAFTNAIQDAVNSSADKVSIKNALAQVSDAKQISTMNPSTQKNIGNALQNSIENMTTNSGGDVSKIPQFTSSGRSLKDFMTIFEHGQMDNMDRGAVYNEAKQFQSAASQLAAKAPKDQFGNLADPQQASLVNTYRTWGNSLEEHALGLGNSDISLPVSDEAKQSMQAGIADLAKTEPALYNTLSDNIKSAQNYKDIRSATAPLVNASKASSAMTGKLNSIPSTTPLQAASGGKAGVLKSMVSSPTAGKLEAALTSRLAGVTGKASASKILPLLARTATISAANLPNDVGEPVNAQNATGTVQNSNMGAGNNMQNNTLTQLYQTLLQQAQTPGAELTPNYAGVTSALGTLAPIIQKQQMASSLLPGLEGSFNAAGGAQGPLAGSLTKLSGIIPGTPANTYNREQGSTAALIAQLLGISPQAAQGALPQLTQAPTTAAPQFGSFQTLLGSLAQ